MFCVLKDSGFVETTYELNFKIIDKQFFAINRNEKKIVEIKKA
jgi:hypothetical protein